MSDRYADALMELRAKGVEAAPATPHDYKAARRQFDIDRGCKSKLRHPSEDAAYGALRSMKRRTGRRQWWDVYLCAHCGGWHISRGIGRGKR